MEPEGSMEEITEKLQKYGMGELVNHIENLWLEEKKGCGGDVKKQICSDVDHDSKSLCDLLIDLKTVFGDRKFMDKYDTILNSISKNNRTFEDIQERNTEEVEYRLPKVINWELYKDNDNVEVDELVRRVGEKEMSGGGNLYISDYKSMPNSIRNKIQQHGLSLIYKGNVAVVMLSAGDGSRLGYDGPKGTYPIGKISKDSFFKIFCLKLRSLSRLVNKSVCNIPLYIMTSSSNYRYIKEYFENNDYFGLSFENVIFFQQDSIPSINLNNGSLLLKDKYTLLKSPNGNGDMFTSLLNKGILEDMKRRRIKYVFTHCIDNPLCKICDPFFVGYTDLFGLQVATKTIIKKSNLEKIGTVVEKYDRRNNKSTPKIIEYSEINVSDEFKYGSIGVHVFSLEFIKFVSEENKLGYHIAVKKVKHCNIKDSGVVQVLESDGIKLETFIFDSFEYVNTPIHCINVDRSEFSPVKSQEGDDTPANCQIALSNLNKSFIRKYSSGDWTVSDRNCNLSSMYLEISPLLSYFGENLREFSNIGNVKHKFVYINDKSEVECYDDM